ncbi:MAG: LPS export ABC transporter permease LptG [Gammaproteobacteria bacterium]
MNTINRYLMRQIAIGLLISTVVLIPLFSFLDLLEQLGDVGKGFYHTETAFLYVLLMLPRRFSQLAPFIALLGNVIALGTLAINRELISMRSAGLSPAHISLSSLKVGLILLLLIAVLEQFVAPPLQQRALALRSEALARSTELGQDLGIWTRDKQHILRIGTIEHGRSAVTVEILRLDANRFLSEYIYAERADIVNSDKWLLHNVIKKTIYGEHITEQKIDRMTWKPFLNPDQVSELTKPAESLSLTDLYQYVHYLRATGQQAEAYSLALWRKIGGGLTTIAMVLLSVPFVFGSVRAGLGNRLVLAGITGIGVYLLDQIIANAGLLLNLNPALTALAPGLLLIGVARFWLQRVP